MKTAVLITGQMRSFATCYPNQRWMLYRKLPDPVFFVSCQNDEQAASAEFLRQHLPRVYIEHVEQPTLPEPDAKLRRHAPFQPSAPTQSIMRQLWALQRVWAFAEETVKRDKIALEFPDYIRVRSDLHFHGFPENLPQLRDDMFPQHCYTPCWSRWGGINDRFAIMGRDAAQAYFNALTVLPDLLKDGCPLHPESIMLAALERANCLSFPTLKAEFSTVRLNGQVVIPDHRWQDIADLAIDAQ